MSKAICLVLDMMNDLVHENGVNGGAPYGLQAKERGVIAKTASALGKARASGLKIGYVRVGFSEDYHECPANSPVFSGAPKAGLFKLGTWGTEVHADLAPQPGDYDFIKHRVSPFHGTTLDLVLRTQGITRIYCSGVSTNAVVQAAVREGHDRDYEMIVLEDCCSALSDAEHRAAIESLARFAQFTTSNAVDFRHPA